MPKPAILIAGAGAIGSAIAAMLQHAGSPVAILGRSAHVEAIARGGLRISGLFGEHRVRGFALATAAAAFVSPFDLILLTVKSYDTLAISDALVPLLSPGGTIVSMQNGLGNLELLIERFGAAQVLGSRVIFGAEIRSPGAVHVTVSAEPVAIGPAPSMQGAHSAGLEARADEIAARLTSGGVAANSCPNIVPMLWTKLFYNAALNPLGALMRLNYGALAEDPDLRAIMNEVIDEAFTVALALGVPLPFASAAEYREIFYSRLVPSTADHYPTMLYDLENRGRTDVAAINGRVAELAEANGIRADTNRMLTRLIQARERRSRMPVTKET